MLDTHARKLVNRLKIFIETADRESLINLGLACKLVCAITNIDVERPCPWKPEGTICTKDCKLCKLLSPLRDGCDDIAGKICAIWWFPDHVIEDKISSLTDSAVSIILYNSLQLLSEIESLEAEAETKIEGA